jgi:uncharacterized protein (DUF342 family)
MDRARILVVEDEELVALAIKKCLERLGYEVPEVVASGEEAVKKSVALEADLVLMDIHLKGKMSGIDAAGLIRDSARVPVVYLTAYSDPDTLEKAKLTEPFGFLLKPFEERSLDTTVKMALSHSRGQNRDHPVRDARSVDGRVEVRISEDRMTAFASFFPPRGAGQTLELSGVQYLLEARGVRSGIDWDTVRSSIQACNTTRKALADVEIAHGTRPSDEINSHVEIEPALLAKDPPQNPDAQTVDFKSLSPFRFVKRGDVLARVVARREGVTGTDVTGVAIAYSKSARRSLRPGRNALTEGDTVVAGCDGKFVAAEDSFWVNEVLEIPGDVDYSTGHIDFPGDVVVQGQIKQGFKVKAGGSLTCDKTIDATEVECGGDLVTNGGILGRVQSTVKAGGQIRAKFIENCCVEAGGDVVVGTGCLNSVVNTLGSVATGSKGVIIGGRICAQKGVTAFQIGSSTGVRTEICCGEDYRARQKLAWIKQRNAELSAKLKEVESSLAVREKGNPRFIEMRDKLKAAIQKMSDSAKGLTASLAGSKDAAVVARGDLHLGVLVEICRIPFPVAKPMGSVRLVLDKSSLVVSAERLGKA